MIYDTDTVDPATETEFSPALLGEIGEFVATPYGTYGKGERLLCGVILFGTASPNRKKKKSFVLDDITGTIVIEMKTQEEMPEIPSMVLVIGTLERRDGINNVKAKHAKQIPINDTKIVGTWHTLKVIESIHSDAKAASRVSELLKKSSFLSLMRRSQLTSNQVSLRHVLFAMNNMQFNAAAQMEK
jgi:hypothetical protein